MAKELPYFRFTATEWLNGDIDMMTKQEKGVFIDICAYYWFKDCVLTEAKLKLRFGNDSDDINRLFECGIMKRNEDSEFVSILFLDEQFDILSNIRKARQEAGRKGGKHKPSKAKAKLKQKGSYKYKDKYKDKDNNKEEKIFDRENVKRLMKEKADGAPPDGWSKLCKELNLYLGTHYENLKFIVDNEPDEILEKIGEYLG